MLGIGFRASLSKSFVMPVRGLAAVVAIAIPALPAGLPPWMCRSTVVAVPLGATKRGSAEMLFASWPVAVCQSESAGSSTELNRPTKPPVPVAYRSLRLLERPAGFGVVPATVIA